VAAKRYLRLTGEAGPINVVEIGVGSGITSNEIAHDLTLSRFQFRYYGIDSMIEEPTGAIEFKWGNMVLIKGDSASPVVRAQVPEEIHFLFVDGDHQYEGVAADLKHYGPRVVPGFLMAMHDIALTGAKQAMAEALQTAEWKLYFKTYEPIKPNDMTPGMAILERVV